MRAVRATRNGAMTGESCQPCKSYQSKYTLILFEGALRRLLFSTFYVCFISMFSLLDALGLITFAFIS